LDDALQEVRTLRVTDVMVKEPVTIDSERAVKEAAILMDRAGCGCLLVTSKGKIVGIVTERDLVTRVLTKGGRISRTKVKSIMSAPIVVVEPEATVEAAAKMMAENRVRRLAVVDRKGLVGLITVGDVAKALAQQIAYRDAIFNSWARIPSPPENIYR